MRAPSLLLLLLASTLFLGNASRDLPSTSTSLQKSAFEIASLHAYGVQAQTSQLPAQPKAAAATLVWRDFEHFGVPWPSPKAEDQANVMSEGQQGRYTSTKIAKATPVQPKLADAAAEPEYAEHDDPPAGRRRHMPRLVRDKDMYETHSHADHKVKEGVEKGGATPVQQEESCLLANTFTQYNKGRYPYEISYSQEFGSCCPEQNTFGPDGPFGPNAGHESKYEPKPPSAVPWPSALHPVQPALLAYCNWTNFYDSPSVTETSDRSINRPVMGVPDLTTGVATIGYTDGVCYLSQAVQQCGLDIPFTPAVDLRTPAAVWTIWVQQATVYMAFAKAYTPPIPGVLNGTAVGFGAYGPEGKPSCGISIAIVGKGIMLDQQEQPAGTAYFTDEVTWCEVTNGTRSPVSSSIAQEPGRDGSEREIFVQSGCLPFSTQNFYPERAAAPTPAPAQAPAPATATEPTPAAAPTPASSQEPHAWQAKLAAAVVEGLQVHSKRSVDVSEKMSADFSGMGDVCSNPIVGFANPGALKITLDLTPPVAVGVPGARNRRNNFTPRV